MNESERKQILERAKKFWREKIATNHAKKTDELKKLDAFQLNPFLLKYLPSFAFGKSDAESIAKAIAYPRILGTSINTILGMGMQTFCSQVLEGFGSGIDGLDIEFTDFTDKRKKYCQLKLGPNTINADDVETIMGHFKDLKNRSRTNKLHIPNTDMIVGVTYGVETDLSSHYRKIDEAHPVYIGKDFWHRLTGSDIFYTDLIQAFGEVAKESDSSALVESVIKSLAGEIEKFLASQKG